jgi:hypothetical protein
MPRCDRREAQPGLAFYGRDYYEQRFSPLDQINDERRPARPRLAARDRHRARPRSDAARRRRRDVCDRIVERDDAIDARTGKQP